MKVKDYLSDDQRDCLIAIQKINNEMHDKEGWESHDTLLSMSICSYMFFVSININKANTEIKLFSSEDNDRVFYEQSNKYEEWYSYIKRKYREAKLTLNKIKL